MRSSRAFAVALVTAATFTDIVAYSIAVPVLPDFARGLGASPTMIGLLFGSFGVTLVGVSMPMGAVSDRVGRKGPLVGGLGALAAASAVLAYATSLPWLFLGRLVQGAADAITWVVGLALVADLYGPSERGRVMGMVMAGTGLGVMIGPSLGGWLYELGGTRLPFLVVAGFAAAVALACLALPVPAARAHTDAVSIAAVVGQPAVVGCAGAVVVVAATIAMLEPVLPLFLESQLGFGPARVGLLFGAGAVVSTTLHPLFGRLTDRWGGRRLTLTGLLAAACMLPALGQAWSPWSATVLYMCQALTLSLVITPSLAYMADATLEAGFGTFGVTYGLYNVAWGLGLLIGPALGGLLLERVGFAALSLVWAPVVAVAALVISRVPRRPKARV